MLRNFLVFLIVCGSALGHVRLRHPAGRSSIWRDPQFAHLNPLVNERDDSYYCGGVRYLQPDPVDNCGVCGDIASEEVPRSNENGGTYGRGIITGVYRPGQEIEIETEFTIPHWGYFEMQLCNDASRETEECFQKLRFGNGDTHAHILFGTPQWINTTIILPTDVTCKQCVLRLHYRGGYQGDCDDGTQGPGCGLQQTFRACADITITPN
ncbi:hypothetical protein HA402_006639 [Bradysia odoriphaga]|nr:hypothetical protein HA402_006639 [Bradysia odoriphaga]